MKVNFTVGRLATFDCPTGKTQAFLWDSKAPGLALRVTAAGARTFVFQSRLRTGQSIRLTIGAPVNAAGRGVYTIPKAQEEARRLQALIDQGRDPRHEISLRAAEHETARIAKRAERQRLELSGLVVWTAYCLDRKPFWSERSFSDHAAFANEGGVQRKRSPSKTIPGPLYALLSRPLASIDDEAVDAWVSRETKARPTRARLGFRLLRGFINWCAENPEYRHLVSREAHKGKRTREKLGKAKAKTDVLQREQLTAWFSAVQKDQNPVASAYLQCLLLTGARREELADLLWKDVDMRWRSLRIGDKVEGERVIPLTPYVARLLRGLPRKKDDVYVFTSTSSKSGRLTDARGNHTRALAKAGLPHTTLHGLRRSFGTLSEWVEVPAGIVAQIQGHKPSATAEKHYRNRPLDLLRLWHERVETWILEQAGVDGRAGAPED
jgi:integrase